MGLRGAGHVRGQLGEKMGPRIREDKGGFCGYEGVVYVGLGEVGELGMEWAARFFDFASLRSE